MVRFSNGVAGLAAAVCTLACLTAPVNAAVVYQFRVSDTLVEIAPGGTAEVDLYLDEIVTGGDTSRLIDESGLDTAQVSVLRLSPLPGDPAILTVATPNEADFDDTVFQLINVLDDEVFMLQGIDIAQFPGLEGADMGGGARSIYLGSVTVAAGVVPGQTTTFEVTDDPLFDETFTIDGLANDNPLDPLIAPTSFEVFIIPEPGTLTLLCVAGCTLLIRRQQPVVPHKVHLFADQ